MIDQLPITPVAHAPKVPRTMQTNAKANPVISPVTSFVNAPADVSEANPKPEIEQHTTDPSKTSVSKIEVLFS
jgi:hypothetical protein